MPETLEEALTQLAEAVPRLRKLLPIFIHSDRYTIGWNPSCGGVVILLSHEDRINVVSIHFFEKPSTPQITKLLREAAETARAKTQVTEGSKPLRVDARITDRCEWCRDNANIIDRVVSAFNQAGMHNSMSTVEGTVPYPGARTVNKMAETVEFAPITCLPGLHPKR